MTETVTCREEGDVVVVDIHGKLSNGGLSSALGELVDALIRAGYRNVLLDLTSVTQLDSFGFRELMGLYATLTAANGQMKLLNTDLEQIEWSRQIGLNWVFEVHERKEMALRSFRAAAQRVKSNVHEELPSDVYLG